MAKDYIRQTHYHCGLIETKSGSHDKEAYLPDLPGFQCMDQPEPEFDRGSNQIGNGKIAQFSALCKTGT
jgi:hypothetical protein